jgi:hypothetical protein
MSSLADGRRGLEDLELWLAGLFTAAELAAADLLLQLSVAGGIDGDNKAASASTTTPSSSPRSASSCCGCAEEKEVEHVVVEDRALPLASAELDGRARKRYRRLSELYAATVPVTAASAAAKENRRKRHHLGDHDGSSSVEEATRYEAETPRERKQHRRSEITWWS